MADLTIPHQKQQQSEEEDDEDYLGDLSKFISKEAIEYPSIKPKKLPPKTLINSSQQQQSSNKKPKFHNWQENYIRKKERKQQKEDEQTLINTQSAIPQSNIGFKLLKQMGYTPGKGIGKEGREEPIGLEIRRGRAGIGREDPVKARVRKEKMREEWKKKTEAVIMEDFEVRKKMEWRSKRVRVNFDKAKAVIDQLEDREPVVEEEKDEGEGNEEEEEVITEEFSSLEQLANWMERPTSGRFKSCVVRSCFCALVYHIWSQRNDVIWNARMCHPRTVVKRIKNLCLHRIIGVMPRKVSKNNRDWMLRLLS